MRFVYDDERGLLSPELRELIEKAARLAITGELELYRDADLPLELSLSVVSADEIRQINDEFRGIDKVTDVLSFPQYSGLEEILWELEDFSESHMYKVDDEEDDCDYMPLPLLGDIVICYDRACEQAEEYGTGVEREIVYLSVHSVFHLLGYDHMEEDEKKEMRALEERVMSQIGLSRD